MIHQIIPGWLARLRAWLRRRLTRTPEPMPARARSNIAKTVVINREEEGAFFYLRDVLKRLDQCQMMLRCLRRFHPDAYNYHRRVGAKVLPAGVMIYVQSLWPEFLSNRPALGMSLFFEKGDKDRVPILFYFEKVNRPVLVESSRFDIYECVVALVHKRKPRAAHFYIALNDKGCGHLLREKTAMRQKLPRGHVLNRTDWRFPRNLQIIYQDRGPNVQYMTLEQYAFMMFCATANYAMMPANDELLVRCTRRGITAAINVSTKRTPYFFADRETTLAVDGKRKRIFHIVRSHVRVLSDGRTSEVCEHYRGERAFTWGGHEVVISAPKNQRVVEFPIAGTPHVEGEDLPPDTIGHAELGDQIATILEDSR